MQLEVFLFRSYSGANSEKKILYFFRPASFMLFGSPRRLLISSEFLLIGE
jgi:hypothetical protein